MSMPGETIWGSLNTCVEIGIEIYEIVAKSKTNEKSGIAIDFERAKTILSDKALAMGEVDSDTIYFESPNEVLIPMYELIKNAAITDKPFLEKAGNLEEIENEGKRAAPEYFGSLSIPLGLGSETVKEIANGISVVKGENDFTLAVHKTLAEYELSSIAQEFGNFQGDYLIYDSTTCAIPLHELSITNEAVSSYIANKDSLEATLATNFRVYTVWNNDIQGERYKISTNEAMPSMFLQEHYGHAANMEAGIDNAFEQADAVEIDEDLER